MDSTWQQLFLLDPIVQAVWDLWKKKKKKEIKNGTYKWNEGIIIETLDIFPLHWAQINDCTCSLLWNMLSF